MNFREDVKPTTSLQGNCPLQVFRGKPTQVHLLPLTSLSRLFWTLKALIFIILASMVQTPRVFIIHEMAPLRTHFLSKSVSMIRLWIQWPLAIREHDSINISYKVLYSLSLHLHVEFYSLICIKLWKAARATICEWQNIAWYLIWIYMHRLLSTIEVTLVSRRTCNDPRPLLYV